LANEHRIASQSAALNRITPESSSLTRRIASILIGIWFGGILLVALAAPTAFRSVNSVLAAPPESVAKALKTLGPSLTRDILRYQASESNRLLFDTWGWVQLGLAVCVVILLLFLSNVGRPTLGLSIGMLLMAALMNFMLIPGISEIGRQMQASLNVRPDQLAERFRLMHYAFTAFELVVVALGTILLVLLLRGRRGSSHRRPHIEEI
jgi:Domain of unknown function (DUF4149)